MANPVAYYDGGNITCFPSSNSKDYGKLHTEFNEARFVTRVAKKNFCIKNPSFTLKATVDITTNTPMLEISEGEASINGMDIIASVPIQIAPPGTAGKWYVAFKLGRDNLGRDFKVGKYKLKGNVLGDLVVGVTKTFEGMYLTYFDKRLDEGDEDPDMLYLGSIYWDGHDFSDIKEDPQKYTRIEAEDVGCYIKDPKHADITYMDLQSLIYKLPDWYFSKEGDVCYGEINVVPGRGSAPSPYNDPMPGFQLRAYDGNTTKMVIKASSIENSTLMRYGDINNDGVIDQADLDLVTKFVNGTVKPTPLQKELACVSGNREGKLTDNDVTMIKNYVAGERPVGKKGEKNPIGKTGCIYGIGDIENGMTLYSSNSKSEIDMDHAQLYTNFDDDIFHIHNPEGICVESGGGNIKLEAYNDIIMKRFDSHAPTLKLTGNVLQMTDPDTPNLNWKLDFILDNKKEKLQQTIGKSILQYDLSNKYLSLLGTDTTRFDIMPPFYMENAVNRCIGTLYFGPEDGNNDNYMRKNEIQLDNNAADKVELKMTDRFVYLKDENKGSTNSYFKVGAADDNNYVKINSNGNTEIKNTTGTAEIKFTGSGTNTARIYHNHNDNYIRIDTNLWVKNDIEADGDGYFNGGDVHIKNAGGQSNLYFTDGSKTYKIYHNNGETVLRMNTTLNMDNNNIENVNNIKTTTLNVGTGYNKLTVDKDGNLNTTGTITGKKVYGAVYNDGVEFMEKENYNEAINPGDVVYFTDNGKVTKYNSQISTNSIAGIVSDESTFGWALGGDGLADGEKVPIALFGRVYLNVDIEVKTGDLLAVNNEGKVVVSESLNRFVIGKATRPSKDGKVYVKVI